MLPEEGALPAKRALIAGLHDPSANPRPYRAAWLLRQLGYEVWTLSPAPQRAIEFVKETLPLRPPAQSAILPRAYNRLLQVTSRLLGVIPATEKLSRYVTWHQIRARHHANQIARASFNIVVVEDLALLTFITTVCTGQERIIFDAREYGPREFESSLIFRVIDKPRIIRQLKATLPMVSGFITVADTLAEEYHRDFGRKPTVVRSTPFFRPPPQRQPLALPLKLVHHGNANFDRGLGVMIDAMARLEGQCELDLYLVGDQQEQRRLMERASATPWVKFRAPVAFGEIHDMLVRYDVGLYLLQPTGFNTTYALPNKIFEFIQARLAVVSGPSPEMMKIVNTHGCGAVSKDFSAGALASLLGALTPEMVQGMQQNADSAAKDLCWENESEKLRGVCEPEDPC